MQLERNLNPTLSAVYVCAGVLMMLAGIVTYALLPNWAVLVLVICGALSQRSTAPLNDVSGVRD
jgi:hypothetical protein